MTDWYTGRPYVYRGYVDCFHGVSNTIATLSGERIERE